MKETYRLPFTTVLRYVFVISLILYQILECNIIFPTFQKTGRKLCRIREQIIGSAMASEGDSDNVTCVWSSNLYALWGLPWNVTFVRSTDNFHSFPVFCRHLCMFTSISRQNQTVGVEENVLYSKTLGRQESVICSYLLHLVWHDSHFQAAQKSSAYALFFYRHVKNSNDVTPM